MQTKDALNYLSATYGNYDFFDSVGLDQFGRYVVYVSHMDDTVYKCVQRELDGKQVLLWFANAKPEVLKAKYCAVKTLNDFRPAPVTQAPTPVEPKEFDNVDLNMSNLSDELDRLEKICGTRILSDVFFEVHDGINAVTNRAADYPNVFFAMQKLYDDFGFDVLYEEIEM